MTFAHSETAEGIRKSLGSILRARRESARRTLSEIAAEAGLSPAHLSEVERGRKEISVERLVAGTHALGLHPPHGFAHPARLLGAEAGPAARPDGPPGTI